KRERPAAGRAAAGRAAGAHLAGGAERRGAVHRARRTRPLPAERSPPHRAAARRAAPTAQAGVRREPAGREAIDLATLAVTSQRTSLYLAWLRPSTNCSYANPAPSAPIRCFWDPRTGLVQADWDPFTATLTNVLVPGSPLVGF